MLTSKSRLVMVIEGTPVAVRFVPHRTDPTKLVLKSGHPEGAAVLLLLADLIPGEAIQGSNFFITEVDKAEFLAALPKLVGTILDRTAPTPERAPVEVEKASNSDSYGDSDCEPYSGPGDVG